MKNLSLPTKILSSKTILLRVDTKAMPFVHNFVFCILHGDNLYADSIL